MDDDPIFVFERSAATYQMLSESDERARREAFVANSREAAWEL